MFRWQVTSLLCILVVCLANLQVAYSFSQNGIVKEVFSPFDSYDFNDIVYALGYPNQPADTAHLLDFEERNSKIYAEKFVARFWTYFVAETSGTHTFHLVCNQHCAIYVGLPSCSTLGTANVLKEIFNDSLSFSEYESINGTAEIDLIKKYRYCIQVLHRGEENTANNWVGVGVTLPDATSFFPLATTQVFTLIGNDKYYGAPRLHQLKPTNVIIESLCPNIPSWTFQSLVLWLQKEGSMYNPTKQYSYHNGTNFTFTGLKPITDYHVYIACIGKQYAVFIDGRVFKTPDGVPSQPPGNFKALLSPPTTFILQWSKIPRRYQNGNLTGFVIEWCRMSRDGTEFAGFWNTIDVPNRNVRVKEIRGFGYYKYYAFRVAGRTSAGAGARSKHIVLRTDDGIPGAPPSNIMIKSPNASSLSIQWEEIPYDAQNGIITAYTISVRSNASDPWTDVILNATEHSYVFHGLKRWSLHFIRIAGHTRNGTGRFSQDIPTKTTEDVPDQPPTNLNVTLMERTVFLVQFDEIPYFEYGNIIEYEVRYADMTETPLVWKSEEIKVEANKSLEVMLTDLKVFTDYSIKVAGATKSGSGVFSQVVIKKTGEGGPATIPANFTCLNETSTGIHCTWNKTMNDTGLVLGIYIYYHIVDCEKAEIINCSSSQEWNVTLGATAEEYHFTNLSFYTEYEFQIQAFNNIDKGPKSEPFKVSTAEDIPSAYPTNVKSFPKSNSSIQLFWGSMPYGTKRGVILGFVITYRRIRDIPNNGGAVSNLRKRRAIISSNQYQFPEYKVMIDPDKRATVISNLDKYQQFVVRLAAYTIKGVGPAITQYVSCSPGFPTNGPNITAIDLYSLHEIRITWNKLDYELSRGIILNYYIVYYAVEVNGITIPPDEIVEDYIYLYTAVRQAIVTGLKPYAVYSIKIAAVTGAGIGQFSVPVLASTCRCPKSLSSSYFNQLPYFSVSSSGDTEGIIGSLVESAVEYCCSSCVNSWGNSTVNWTSDGSGNSSLKNSYAELKSSFFTDTHIILPVQFDARWKVLFGGIYIPVAHSNGFIVYSPPHDYLHAASDVILTTVTNMWPYGVFIVTVLVAYGIFMWIVQCNPMQIKRTNQEEFPDDFSHGAGAGVWWAVNTFFRLGEGRTIARGKPGRCFSLVAMIMGVIISSILISTTTVSFLTYGLTPSRTALIYKKIGILDGAYDRYKIIRMGGQVIASSETAGGLRHMLKSGNISRFVVDSFYSAHHHDNLISEGAVPLGEYNRPSSYGFVLSGDVKYLGSCLRKYMVENEVVVAERMAKVLSSTHKITFEDEVQQKMKGLGKYTSGKWLLAVKISAVLLVLASICGCLFDMRRKRKLKERASYAHHDECQRIYKVNGKQMILAFQRRCKMKLEELEVKHAFERIKLKKEIRRKTKFLSPNDVFKYKF